MQGQRFVKLWLGILGAEGTRNRRVAKRGMINCGLIDCVGRRGERRLAARGAPPSEAHQDVASEALGGLCLGHAGDGADYAFETGRARGAWIADTNTKVIEVAMDHPAYSWGAEEIHAAHPHLPVAQIHAALSYNHDRKAEFDAEMQRQAEDYDRRREAASDQPTRVELLKRLGRA